MCNMLIYSWREVKDIDIQQALSKFYGDGVLHNNIYKLPHMRLQFNVWDIKYV